ncbi:MAG: SIMPL domain-containing protein [Candidatus Gracilibacteria bacterium]|nr:SIMPL domain-containing protein [Candidatus Gracilibacteria bacterium]
MNQILKSIQTIALVVFLLVASYGAWMYVDAYSRSTQYRSFSVTGEGEAVGIPDVAQFGFSVLTEGDTDIAKIQTENTTKMNEIVAYLKEQGVEEKDIKTSNYNLSPRYQYHSCRDDGVCPPAEIVGYSINQTVSSKLREFDKIGDVLAGVVSKGANDVNGPNFTIDDTTLVENEARAAAMQNAKEKADAIATAGGFKIGKLLSIYEEQPYIPYYDNYAYADGMGGMAKAEMAPSPVIEPGSQEVTVKINLTYEIE